MGLDPIDDAIQQAEGWPPPIGDWARTLRFAWEVWRKEPVNAHVFRRVAQALHDQHHTASGHTQNLSDGISSLLKSWQGDPGTKAYEYLGPALTPAQMEHAGGDEPSAPLGKGWELWHNLSTITSLLEYNTGAHSKAADTYDQIRSLHDDLDFNLKLAAGDLAAMVVTAFIPIGDLVGEPLEAAGEAVEVGRTAEGARAVIEVERIIQEAREAGQAAQLVEKVTEVTQEARRVARWAIAARIAMALIAVGGMALAPWEVYFSNTAPHNADKYYPPSIQTEAERQRYDYFFSKYGDMQLAADLTKSGLDGDQADALAKRYGIDVLKRIANDPNLGGAKTLEDLFTLRNMPGIDRVVKSLLEDADTNASGIQGDLYELWQMAANVDRIAEVALPAVGTDGKPKKGPDARLKDGTLVQMKSYTWTGPAFAYARDIKQQYEVTRANYPGVPIVFWFNGENGPLPAAVLQQLNDLAPFGVTWEYHPPLSR